LRIAQRPQVTSDKVGLARMHQRTAVHVVDEEVAVLAEVHFSEDIERAGAQHRIVARVVAAGVVERADCRGRELDVVFEFDFLTGHVRGLGGRVLRFGERRGFPAYTDFNAGDGRQKGHDRQQDNLCFEFHRRKGGRWAT
jgi:hypothetical protein